MVVAIACSTANTGDISFSCSTLHLMPAVVASRHQKETLEKVGEEGLWCQPREEEDMTGKRSGLTEREEEEEEQERGEERDSLLAFRWLSRSPPTQVPPLLTLLGFLLAWRKKAGKIIGAQGVGGAGSWEKNKLI